MKRKMMMPLIKIMRIFKIMRLRKEIASSKDFRGPGFNVPNGMDCNYWRIKIIRLNFWSVLLRRELYVRSWLFILVDWMFLIHIFDLFSGRTKIKRRKFSVDKFNRVCCFTSAAVDVRKFLLKRLDFTIDEVYAWF